MKRYLILLAMLLAIVSGVTAQEPIAMDGKEWNIIERIPYYIDLSSDVRMWIEGDTIVDGTACKKLYTHTQELWEGGKERLEVGYCRQDGDKYYQNGKLMFDFGLNVGDTFSIHEYDDLVFACMVTHVGDTVLLDGIPRRYLHLSPYYYGVVHPSPQDTWIEGIGSLSMGIVSNDFYHDSGVFIQMRSCSYYGLYIYKKNGTNVDAPQHLSVPSTPYYDLQGRPVVNPARGIYIKDGRKISLNK